MKRRSTFGWLDLLRGVLFLVLGIITLFYPQSTLSGLVVFFGIIAIISGVSDIVWYVKIHSHTGFGATAVLVTGIISVLSGILLILNPIIGRWILNFIVPIWLIAHCISRIVSFSYMREVAGNAASIIVLCLNILGLLLGILMIFNTSIFTISLGLLISIDCIAIGIGSIVEAFSNLGASDTDRQIL